MVQESIKDGDVSVKFDKGIVDEACIFKPKEGVLRMLLATPAVRSPECVFVSKRYNGTWGGSCSHVLHVRDGDIRHEVTITVPSDKTVCAQNVQYGVAVFVFTSQDEKYVKSVYPSEG